MPLIRWNALTSDVFTIFAGPSLSRYQIHKGLLVTKSLTMKDFFERISTTTSEGKMTLDDALFEGIPFQLFVSCLYREDYHYTSSLPETAATDSIKVEYQDGECSTESYVAVNYGKEPNIVSRVNSSGFISHCNNPRRLVSPPHLLILSLIVCNQAGKLSKYCFRRQTSIQ